MAALTSDRVYVEKRFPRGVDFPGILGDNQVIYAGSIFGVGNDGKFYNLTTVPGGVTIKRVLFAESHLELGQPSAHMHQGGGQQAAAEGISGVEVYLDATGLAVGDEDAIAYALDDHTVTKDGTGGKPVVGRIQKVMAANYALVFIDGKTRDVAL